MGFRGIDVRQSGDRILIRASLKTSLGARVVSGTTTLILLEFQSDGSVKTYDWNDNTFKSTSVTTLTQSMTYRPANAGAQDTGLWTYMLTTVSGFTRGNIYLAIVSNSGASPTDQEKEFQYGDADGDFPIWTLIQHDGTAQAGAASTITLASSASSIDQTYKGAALKIYGGLGAGQTRVITNYVGSTKVATVDRPWATTPDNTSLYAVIAIELPVLDVNLAVTAGTITDKTGYGLSLLESLVVTSGTAAAGSASTITLAGGAGSTTDLYKGMLIKIYGGTGVGQVRAITGYNGGTKVATIDHNWITNPDNTSLYAVLFTEGFVQGSDVRLLVSGDTHTSGETVAAVANGIAVNVTGAVQTNAGNSPTTFQISTTGQDNFLNGQILRFKPGASLANQASRINGYTSSTQVATFDDAFTGTPVVGDPYEIIPAMSLTALQILTSLTSTGTKIAVDTITGGVYLAPGDVSADGIARIKGLIGENVAIRQSPAPTYDGNNRLINYNFIIYDTAANATTNNPATGKLYEYNVAITYTASGEIATQIVTKVS